MAPWLMAMISGKRRIITETFTSSQTWVCPLGVSMINTLTGKGADGSFDSGPGTTAIFVNINYQSSGSGTGSVTWANFDNTLNGWVSTLNATGSLTYDRSVISVFPDGSATTTDSGSETITAIPGTTNKLTFGAWASSGAITASGDGGASYNYFLAGAPGADTTGFARTFAGGAASTAATPVAVDNVPVVGGAGYALSIPAGGSITITYYR